MGLPIANFRSAARTSLPLARALFTWFGVAVMTVGFASCVAAVIAAQAPTQSADALVIAQVQR
jgi:hypothetical protein